MTFNLYTDIASLVNNIQEGALFVLRGANVLAATVTNFTNENGMNPRKGYDWNSVSFTAVGESDDLVSQNFTQSLRVTLNPARYAAQIFMTDARARSDWLNYRDSAVMELGMGAANKVDTDIAGNFPSLTGGTVGTAGGTLSWSNIIQGVAKLRQNKIPGPYTCVLGEGQWYHLLNDVTVDASAFKSDNVVDAMLARYYTTSMLGGVVFAVTPNVSGNAGTAAYGAVYNRLAMAYDQRKAFGIEPERDASREGWELNTSMWYAHGVWAPAYGVQLIGTDVIA